MYDARNIAQEHVETRHITTLSPDQISKMAEITLPYRFKPRDYQVPFFRAVDNGIKRVLLVWPRRHGKDKSCFNALVKEAFKRVGNYYYIFPEYNQGRKALWDNIDRDGVRTIDHIPSQLTKSKNATEMKIELINGSIIQIVGAADIDRIVGTNPIGVVFSEYSLIDPLVWGYVYPILAENGGFAWFNMTPRGKNHGLKLLESSLSKPDWFVSHLNAKECGVFNVEQLEKIRQEYFDLYGDYQLYDQEFMTSFEAPIQGSYFAAHIDRAEEDGRITNVPYESLLKVHTYWDLGIDDSMTIWFVQFQNREIRLIDYLENSGEGIPYYINELSQKPYNYDREGHFAPHDIEVRELTTGVSRKDTAKSLGIDFQTVPRPNKKEEGIDAIRNILSRCWFDAKKCEKGIEALRNYRKEWDEKNKVFKNHPVHDWSSHGTDGFQTLALSNPEPVVAAKGYAPRWAMQNAKAYEPEWNPDEYLESIQ